MAALGLAAPAGVVPVGQEHFLLPFGCGWLPPLQLRVYLQVTPMVTLGASTTVEKHSTGQPWYPGTVSESVLV